MMARQKPPTGYLTPTEAGKILGPNMLYKYKKAGLLKHYKPPHRQHGYYLASDVYRLAQEKHDFFEVQDIVDATFSRATFSDMESIMQLGLKIFHEPDLLIPTITRQQWLFKEPRGHYVLKQPNGNVIAYTHLIALPQEKIELLLRDELIARQLTTDDIQAFKPDQHYSCYLVAIGIDPAIQEPRRRSAYSSVLLRGIGKDLASLGKEGILIDRLYAYAERNEGILLCAKMGMNQWAQPIRKSDSPRRYTFYLDVLDSTMPFLQPYIRNIHEWLKEHSAEEELQAYEVIQPEKQENGKE